MAAHSVAPDAVECPETIPDLASRPRRSRSRRAWLWLLPLAAVPLGFVTLPLFTTTPEPPALSAALPVQVIPVEAVTQYELERTYSGELVARRSSALGFERAGTVVELRVEEGDRVAAGQLLAVLDARSLDSQRQELLAQRAQAQAQAQELQAGPRPEAIAAARAAVADLQQQLELAERKTERREYLYTEGAIAREDLDQETYNARALRGRLGQAQSQLDELLAGTRREQIAAQQARVQQLEAAIQSLDVELDKSILRAPFAGRVSQRAVDEGVVVSPGTPVVHLLEQGSLEARIGVPSLVADRLPLGSEQRVQVGERTYVARVTALLPELEANSRTVTAVLALPAEADQRAGETAQLRFRETEAAEGFWLPAAALVPGDRGLWSVYVLGTPGPVADTYTVARRDVDILHTEGDRLLVRGTLQAGERAIASGTHRLVAGQVVQVAPARTP